MDNVPSIYDGTFPPSPDRLAILSLHTRLFYHEFYMSYDLYDTLHVLLDHTRPTVI
jgi:hypothetical protein